MCDRGRLCRINNSVIFSRNPIGSEEFLSRTFEVLGIIIDRRHKGRLHKMEK